MASSTIIEVIFSNGPAIVGACLLACLGACLARRNAFKARRAAAAAKFRSQVLSALDGLYAVPASWPKNELRIRDELKDRFPALQAAVAEFQPCVPWSRRRAYSKSWRRDRLGDEGREIDQQDYWQYVPLQGTSVINGVTTTYDHTRTDQQTFKSNVEGLLQFAGEA